MAPARKATALIIVLAVLNIILWSHFSAIMGASKKWGAAGGHALVQVTKRYTEWCHKTAEKTFNKRK
jgi:hypothetical protein